MSFHTVNMIFLAIFLIVLALALIDDWRTSHEAQTPVNYDIEYKDDPLDGSNSIKTDSFNPGELIPLKLDADVTLKKGLNEVPLNRRELDLTGRTSAWPLIISANPKVVNGVDLFTLAPRIIYGQTRAKNPEFTLPLYTPRDEFKIAKGSTVAYMLLVQNTHPIVVNTHPAPQKTETK